MTEDEKFLRDLLEKIAAHERAKETAAARYHAHAQNERRKYLSQPELVSAFSQLQEQA